RLANISDPGPVMSLDVYVRPRELIVQPVSLAYLQSTTVEPGGSRVTVQYRALGTIKSGSGVGAIPTPIRVDATPGGANSVVNPANYILESPRGVVKDLTNLLSGPLTATVDATTGVVTVSIPLRVGQTGPPSQSSLRRNDNYILTVRNVIDSLGRPLMVANRSNGFVDGRSYPATVQAGSANVPLLRLDVRHSSRSLDEVTLDSVLVSEAGSSKNDADVQQFTLWEDANGNAVFEPGADRVLGQSALSNQVATLSGLAARVPRGQQKTLFVSVDLSDVVQTNPPLTIAAQLDNFQSIIPVLPGSVQEKDPVTGNTHYPMVSGSLTVVPRDTRLIVTGISRVAASVNVGTTDVPVLSLLAQVDRGTGTITRITVNLEGTATSPGDIGQVKLVNDINGNGAIDVDIGETTIAATNFFTTSGGAVQATFDGLSLDITTAVRSFLLTLDITTAATIGRTFRLTLPDTSAISAPGTNVDASTFPIASSQSIIGGGGGPGPGPGQIPPVTFPAGVSMISMPFDFGATLATTVLETPDVARWNPATQQYQLASFVPFPLELGRGYFVRYGNGGKTVTQQGSLAPTSTRFPVVVQSEWNLIGYPYPPTGLFVNGIDWNDTRVQFNSQTLTLAQAVAAGIVRPVLFTLNTARTNYVMVTSLVPYRGYWARSVNNNVTLLLSNTPLSGPPILPERTLNTRPARRDPLYALLGNNFRDGWSIQLIARAGQAEDASNYVGVSATAQDGRDFTDVEKPPALFSIASTVDLALVQPDNATRFAIDLRAPNREQYTWEFVVTTNQPNVPVSITPDLSRLPKPYRALLIDLETGQRRYLRTAPGYTYPSGAGQPRRFQLVVFRGDPNPLRVSGVQVLRSPVGGGARFALVLNRAAHVRLRVHSVTGQVVADLPLGARPAGVTSVVWDGKSQRGVQVGRGAYVLVVNATDEVEGRTVQEVKTFIMP
ncbi:MAG: FlgD immunoglobulin-like domain containing protein, partial [Abditibacteriales bacterium]|nr:FlgD immunoglobulin-like domain containing protein [Abditibacteriales bacterium]